MGVILFGIYIVLSIVLTVIGVFIGNIIFFDSILLAALSGLLCHMLWTVHPAFCLLSLWVVCISRRGTAMYNASLSPFRVSFSGL